MPRVAAGSGRALTARETSALRASFGPQIPAPLDLNSATAPQLGGNSAIGKRLANRIVRQRKSRRIATPADLYHAGIVDLSTSRMLAGIAYGRDRTHPLAQRVEIDGRRLYVGEPFALRIAWLKRTEVPAAIVSLQVRFPSGRTAGLDVRLSRNDIANARTTVGGWVSGESGELYVLATVRDAAGGISRQSALFTVVTRNPVQLYVTPDYLTQSGSAGAPKYDFGNGRWYCHSHIRWVNGEARTVNLGRRVDVHVTDAGIGTVADFSFNLSGDIVIPAHSTVYGTWYTFHGAGGIHDEFSAKGDLTFRYTMNGSGFSPTRTVVWRTMRTIGYNLIRVGDFTAAERNEYERAATTVASGIFRSRDMTVYGAERYRIEGTRDMDADKERYRFIDSQDEINVLRNKYTVSNWYLDVFMVEGRWDGAFGSSPTGGPVDKEGNSSGLVIRKDSDTVNLGQTFAHEAGHYLGLDHADEEDGCGDTDPASPTISDNFIFSSSLRDSTVITGCQINTMRQHGLVRSMTP